jgi:ATP-dependent Clp protease adaptor protein ClpS
MSTPAIFETEEIAELKDRSWMVTVYDNPTNTYEEVIGILILATHCDLEEAHIETWEIDHLGKSVVHLAGREECETVSEVISQIGIKVEVTES